MKLKIDKKTHVLVLTGAGVSQESGLATFRDVDGLWEKYEVEDLASVAGFERDPKLVWDFYNERRLKAARAEPNAAHLALARLEQQLGDRFLLVTQNVDGLHQRAGSRRVIELHGNLFQTKCSRCQAPPEFDPLAHEDVPVCQLCGAPARPAVTWFGEPILDLDWRLPIKFMVDASQEGRNLLFVAIGTSGQVWPAAGFVSVAHQLGGRTLLINREPTPGEFAAFIQGDAGRLLPALVP